MADLSCEQLKQYLSAERDKFMSCSASEECGFDELDGNPLDCTGLLSCPGPLRVDKFDDYRNLIDKYTEFSSEICPPEECVRGSCAFVHQGPYEVECSAAGQCEVDSSIADAGNDGNNQ